MRERTSSQSVTSISAMQKSWLLAAAVEHLAPGIDDRGMAIASASRQDGFRRWRARGHKQPVSIARARSSGSQCAAPSRR